MNRQQLWTWGIAPLASRLGSGSGHEQIAPAAGGRNETAPGLAEITLLAAAPVRALPGTRTKR
jgi:hypothetical protein